MSNLNCTDREHFIMNTQTGSGQEPLTIPSVSLCSLAAFVLSLEMHAHLSATIMSYYRDPTYICSVQYDIMLT